MTGPRALVVVAVALAVLLPAGAGHAAWATHGVGIGQVLADSLPRGSQPQAEVDGRDIGVSWDSADSAAVKGYEVRRYPAGEPDPEPPAAGCDGVVTETSCTEADVPPGEWQYTITPRSGDNWSGAESPRSEVARVLTTVHVAQLDGRGEGSANTWTAVAIVTVHDEQGQPVAGVTVEGGWDTARAPGSSTDTCTTGADGTCEVDATDMPRGGGNEATYTVESLHGDGVDHDPAQDVHTSVTIHSGGDVTPS